jgi:hypothetical protein
VVTAAAEGLLQLSIPGTSHQQLLRLMEVTLISKIDYNIKHPLNNHQR